MALRSKGGPIVGRGSFASEPSATTIAAQIAKVKVDPQTGKVDITELYNSLDVGKAINPMACEGQLEGGLVQRGVEVGGARLGANHRTLAVAGDLHPLGVSGLAGVALVREFDVKSEHPGV